MDNQKRIPSQVLVDIIKNRSEESYEETRKRMKTASVFYDLLKERNITPQKFAESIGVDYSLVQLWLSGNVPFDDYVIASINANPLGIYLSKDYLS